MNGPNSSISNNPEQEEFDEIIKKAREIGVEISGLKNSKLILADNFAKEWTTLDLTIREKYEEIRKLRS